METKIIKKPIKKKEIIDIAKQQFGDLIKVVIDVGQEIMAIGGELHADQEALLIEKEHSKREDIWGINLYPEKSEEEWIEFDSLINLKPSFGNKSRGVENAEAREKIKSIIKKLVAE